MRYLALKIFMVAAFLGVISGCVTKPVVYRAGYNSLSRIHIYALDVWEFKGRLAMRGTEDSWSASINWRHKGGGDKLKLSGPLGQGALSIVMDADTIVIDKGNGKSLVSSDPDALVGQQLGVFVPVRALRYWVLGLNQPDVEFAVLSDGFIQSGWTVRYLEWTKSKGELMPRKMVASRKKLKLKLVIDEWVLYDDSRG